jgi:hypothetical protein
MRWLARRERRRVRRQCHPR